MKNVVLSALVSLCISVVSLVVYDRFFAPKIAFVNLDQFIEKTVSLQQQGFISEEKANALIEAARAYLDTQITRNTTVLNSKLMLINGRQIDLTHILQKELINR